MKLVYVCFMVSETPFCFIPFTDLPGQLLLKVIKTIKLKISQLAIHDYLLCFISAVLLCGTQKSVSLLRRSSFFDKSVTLVSLILTFGLLKVKSIQEITIFFIVIFMKLVEYKCIYFKKHIYQYTYYYNLLLFHIIQMRKMIMIFCKT